MSEGQEDQLDVEEEAPVEEAAQQETTPVEVEEDTSAGQPASAGSFTLDGNQL